MENLLRKIIRNILKIYTGRSERKRRFLACAYLAGRGLEIGALHNPLKVPPQAHVTYIDRMTEAQLRQHYPELADKPLVPVHMVDNGDTLALIKDESIDFIIANHMIEHSENPLLALKNWIRVLRLNGILYLAVPNKRKTFDTDRPVTSLTHIVRDYEEGPRVSRVQHFEEWVVLVNKVESRQVKNEMKRLSDMDYSIHYHVWDPPAFIDLLRFCQIERAYPFRIEHTVVVGHEIIVILRKNPTSRDSAADN
jgi:predicted SAM-dependent methyltransferase